MAPASVHFDHCDPSPLRCRIGAEPRASLSRYHPAAALSTACDAGERPLTLSVAPRSPLSLSTGLRSEHRGPLPSHPRQGTRLVRPRTPSIAKCSLGDAFASRILVGARHRCLGFATEDPASGLLSPPRCSRPERLDPTSAPGALRSWTRRATCRLSTSATQTAIREHFRRIVRTPRTAPMVAHERSCFSSHRLSTAERSAGGRASYGMANRVFTGQGPALGQSAH